MDTEFEERKKTVANVHRTYFDGMRFLDDMRKGNLIECFLLSEGAFQEIIGEVAASKKVAEEVNNAAVPISLKADKGLELGGILELAETIANGR
jgi:hypothetical protein